MYYCHIAKGNTEESMEINVHAFLRGVLEYKRHAPDQLLSAQKKDRCDWLVCRAC
jgi:hypothetical protein